MEYDTAQDAVQTPDLQQRFDQHFIDSACSLESG